MKGANLDAFEKIPGAVPFIENELAMLLKKQDSKTLTDAESVRLSQLKDIDKDAYHNALSDHIRGKQSLNDRVSLARLENEESLRQKGILPSA